MPDVITILRDNVATTQVAGADVLLPMAVAAATAASADHASAAEAAAAQTASDLQQIEDIASGAPDAPSILNKVDKSGNGADFAEPAAVQANIGLFANVAGMLAATQSFAEGRRLTAGRFEYEVAASGASDHDLVTDGGVKLYALPDHRGRWDITALGLTDGADATARFKTAVARGRSKLTGDPAYPVTVDSFLDITDGDADHIELSGIVFDCSGGGYVRFSGTQTALPDLGADIAIGARTITFASAHGMVAGDTFNVRNPTDRSANLSRVSYKDGCRYKVSAVVSSTVVRIEGRSPAAFAAADVDCRKTTGGPVILDRVGVTPSPTGDSPALEVYRRSGVRMSGVYCPLGAAYTALRVQQCWDVILDDPRAAADQGDAYSVVLAGNQNVQVKNVQTVLSSRHSVAVGGALDEDGGTPDRNIIVRNSLLRSDGDFGAADFHGTAFSSSYVNCLANNGVAVAGRDVSFVECDIYATDADENCAVVVDVAGGYVRFDRCRFHTFGANSSYGAIYIFPVFAKEDVVVEIIDPVLEHHGASSDDVRFIILNAGSVTNWDAASGSFPDSSLIGRGAEYIATSNGSGATAGYLTGDRIVWDGSAFVKVPDVNVKVIVRGAQVRGVDATRLVSIPGTRDVSSRYSVWVDDSLEGPPGSLLLATNAANLNIAARWPTQTLTFDTTLTTSDAALFSGNLTLRWEYPRKPDVIATGLTPVPDGVADYSTIKQTNVYAVDLRTNIGRIGVYSIAGTNWGASLAVTAALTVGIRDF